VSRMQGQAEWTHGGRIPWSKRVYDGLSLLLLMWPATAGVWLMGSTRTWGFAPGLFFSFLGSMLVLARPLVFRDTPKAYVPPGFWAFAVLVVYVVLRVPGSLVPYAARWDALRWVCLLAAAWSWSQLGGRAHRWKWLLGVLLMAAALDGLYAWIQHVNSSEVVLWAPRPEQYGLRASGTYLCPNHFANLLAMLIPVALVLAFLPDAGFPLRLMAVYYLIISLPALYWTQSRSGWIGMMAGLVMTGLLLAWRKSRAWFLIALVALPLCAAGGGWVAWKLLPAVQERMGQVLEDPEAAGGIRMEMWRDAPAMFKDRPALGFGGGSYVWAYPPYQRHVKQHLNYDFAHNEYIQLLLEYGAIGVGLACAALLACIWGLVRGVLKARSKTAAWLLAGASGGLVASLLHALFDFNFHIFPNPHALVWLGGVAWGVWFSLEKRDSRPAGRQRILRWAGAGVGILACGIGAWLSLAGGISYVWNLKGEISRTRMEQDEAEADYRKAMAWDDENWQPYLGMGNIRATQAMWYRNPDFSAEREGKKRLAAEATQFFESAIARNPADMTAVFGLARSCNVVGDLEAALAQYRRAATYQRHHIFYREQLGIQLRRMGREDEALDVFRRNVEEKDFTDVSRLNIRSLERKKAKAAAAVTP